MSVEPHEPPGPGKPAASAVTPPAAAPEMPRTELPPPKQLTPEEQMALFEQELKETDWGHQPC